MATHSSVLAWRIPWTEEPGGLHSMRSQSQIQLSTDTHTHTHTHTHHPHGLIAHCVPDTILEAERTAMDKRAFV